MSSEEHELAKTDTEQLIALIAMNKSTSLAIGETEACSEALVEAASFSGILEGRPRGDALG
jgi:hypothetical protein